MSASSTSDKRPFRQRLDDVLRQRDADAVRAFLIDAGQWSEDQGGDTEFAMWMMIAGSPTLTQLHPEAEAWLRAHGHEAEADIIAGGRKKARAQTGNARRGQRPSADQRQGGPGHGAGQYHRGGTQRHSGSRPPGGPTSRDRRSS